MKSDQEWNVSGEGSKITIGDGNWGSFTSVGDGWRMEYPNSGAYNTPRQLLKKT